MGNGKIKQINLKRSELLDFNNMTSFSDSVIITLYQHYEYYCSMKNDDGVIDYDEFCVMINRKDNSLSRKIFNTIDINRDQCINFREFLKFLSTFSTGSIQDQYDLSYKIFSNEYTNLIEKDYLKKIIKEGVKADMKISFFIDDFTIDEIVSKTFRDSNAMNKIQYVELLSKMPWILNWFKFDIERIRENKKRTPHRKRASSCF